MLGVHKLAANNALRAELGIFPLAIFCLKSCVNYWLHVLEQNDNNLVYNAYSDVISHYTGFSHKIKSFLGKINFSHVWANQSIFSKAKLLHAVTVRLKDSYISFWRKCLFGPRQANLVFIAYASSEGSGEPAHPRSLARTFAARSYKQ